MERDRYGSRAGLGSGTPRLFRYIFFVEQGGEQGVVSAPSFVLALGSEMGIGRTLQMQTGGAGRRGATRLAHVKRIIARDRVRRNLVDFQS